jgi:hypothetical protein
MIPKNIENFLILKMCPKIGKCDQKYWKFSNLENVQKILLILKKCAQRILKICQNYLANIPKIFENFGNVHWSLKM